MVFHFWVQGGGFGLALAVLLLRFGPGGALCRAAATAATEDLVLFLLYVIGLQALFR